MDLVKVFIHKKITVDLLNSIIAKIVIHEKMNENGEKVIPMEVYYRFIDKIKNGN